MSKFSGIPEGLDLLAIGETLRLNSDLRFAYILKDNKHINQFSKVFKKLFPSINFVKIPSWDCVPYDFSSPDSKITGERINAIINLRKRETIYGDSTAMEREIIGR